MRETYRKKYWKYFDADGFIIGNLKELPRINSPMPMDRPKERFFEILKLDGDREIRFAVQRNKDCGCRNFIVDSSELIRVLDYLKNPTAFEKPELFDEFDFNDDEKYQLKMMLEKEYG